MRWYALVRLEFACGAACATAACGTADTETLADPETTTKSVID